MTKKKIERQTFWQKYWLCVWHNKLLLYGYPLALFLPAAYVGFLLLEWPASTTYVVMRIGQVGWIMIGLGLFGVKTLKAYNRTMDTILRHGKEKAKKIVYQAYCSNAGANAARKFIKNNRPYYRKFKGTGEMHKKSGIGRID